MIDDMTTEFAGLLRNIRILHGYTQSQLAQLLEVRQSTIANYEKGLRMPDALTLQKMAAIFHISIEDLLSSEHKSMAQSSANGSPANGSARRMPEHVPLIYDQAKEEIITQMIRLNGDRAKELLLRLHQQGIRIEVLYYDILSDVLHQIGALWQQNIIDIWQEHAISQLILDLMGHLMSRTTKESTISLRVLAVAAGMEKHTIGLKMISDLLSLHGCEITYAGANIPVNSVLEAIEQRSIDVVMLTVTLADHIDAAKNLITAIRKRFDDKSPLILIGGGAFSNPESSWQSTGADFYGNDFDDILRIAKMPHPANR